ncbi:MAG: DUF4169 family protein [Pseudomonadota bacterium]
MAEIINLRRARKRRDRDEKSKLAEANRRATSITKRDRKSVQVQNDLEAKRLDAHKLEPKTDK